LKEHEESLVQIEKELISDCFPPLFFVLRNFDHETFTTLDAVLAARSVLRLDCSYWYIRDVLLSGVRLGVLRFEEGRFRLVFREYMTPANPRKEWRLRRQMLRLILDRKETVKEPSLAKEENVAELAANFCPLPNRRNFLLVNRAHRLPEAYCPEGLVDVYPLQPPFLVFSETVKLKKEAFEAFSEMSIAAAREGLCGFLLLSGYRSRERQAEIFVRGKPGYVAQPGTSEHETGLAMDISVETGDDTHMEDTPHFAWLLENAWQFGFILRYPKGKERFTGVFYEPNHFRFVGQEAARAIREGGLSLEEYCAQE